jgi:hypothetical protein
VTVPVDVRTVPNVELLKVGTFDGAGGTFTIEPEHLASAVEAYHAKVVPPPPLKLGHSDPRFDGSPALGAVARLRLRDNGSVLVGDLVGVPRPVAALLPHAYPERSIEGVMGFTDDDGREWPFVLTAVALLGDTRPAVGTLRSLRDVGALYGIDDVAASSARVVVVASIPARTDDPAARARAVQVAAARRRRTHRINPIGV